MSSTAFASSNEMTSLRDLSDAECIAFLRDNGVEIPELYENELDCVPFVRAVIEWVETNPNADILYECYALLKFANEIEIAVRNYYENADATTYDTSTSASILKDNVVYGSWTSEYESYNCYGYAIEMVEWLLPGVSSWLAQNEPMETYYYNGYADVSNIANWIKSDLEYFGLTVNTVSTIMPNTQVSEHTRLICFRKDMDETFMLDRHGLWVLNHDFHFMRLDNDGCWYHKPGDTNPLRYKYVPNNSDVWVSEGYDGENNEYFRYDDFAYESDIYFIEYITPHEWEYRYSGANGGTHQHILTCTVCGGTNGTAVACSYLLGSDTCKICGHNKNLIVTALDTPEGIYAYMDD